MNTALIIAAVVLAIAVGCGAIAWTVARRNRSAWLQKHFGPEYDAALRRFGNRYQAEKELAARLDERMGVPVRQLLPEEKELFAARWHEIQAHFVEDPVIAVREADSLISETMRVRGYPTGAFEVRDENVLVDYPRLARNYREAHRIAMSTREGAASLEDLRRAMVYYRALFEELLEAQGVH
jgi:hypothetical protein